MFIIFLIAFLLGLCSCEQNSLTPTFQDLPVVEGYLKAGETITFKISRQVATDASATHSQDNLDALNPLLQEGETTLPVLAQGNGVYTSSRTVEEGKTYTLSFTYNQKTVRAKTLVPSIPQNYRQSVTEIKGFSFGNTGGGFPTIPDPIKLTWDNTQNEYYVVVAENVETNPEAINSGQSELPARIFRNQPTQANNYEIRAMQFSYYGKHHLKLYHINSDYAVLYGNGGNTSQNLFTPTSSIEHGVGIFTGMAGKVLELRVTK